MQPLRNAVHVRHCGQPGHNARTCPVLLAAAHSHACFSKACSNARLITEKSVGHPGTHTYVHTHTYSHKRLRIQTGAHTLIHMHTCAHTHKRVQIQTGVHTLIHTHTHSFTYTRARKHIQTSMPTHALH